MGRTTTHDVQGDANIRYVAPPTLVHFHKSPAFIRVLLGSVGSGKSVSAMMECFLLACGQAPNSDNVRQTRTVMIRSSFPELKSTTVQTHTAFFGSIGNIVYDSPIRYTCKMPLPDGTMLDWTVWFLAIDGSEKSLMKMRSLEVSNAFINEANLVESETVSVVKSRLGRFPAKKDGVPCTRPCLIMDSNFGYTTSPLKKLLDEAPENHAFFIQPPAVFFDPPSNSYLVNPYAENVENLPTDYYKNMMTGMAVDQIKQLLANEWVTPHAGKPVYPEYAPSRGHLFSGYITHLPHRPIIVGMDYGLKVAATFGQLSPLGGLTILAELYEPDMDLDTFIESRLTPFVNQRFPNAPIVICGDPSGKNRSSIDSRSAFSTLKEAGYMAVPSHTNDPEIRIGDVKYFLNRQNGFTVSSECKMIVDGFEGAYGYERVINVNAQEVTYKDQPKKNEHSHPHDSLQYLCGYARRGRYVTVAPKGWEASRRKAAMAAQAKQRMRPSANPDDLQGIPAAQDPHSWHKRGVGAPSPHKPQNSAYNYV